MTVLWMPGLMPTSARSRKSTCYGCLSFCNGTFFPSCSTTSRWVLSWNLVRQGDDTALFNAVRVDRSVLLAAPCADRLSRAEMLNDKDFLRHLRSAIRGPTKKHMEAIQDLRYSIVALRECGFDRFSDKDLERLFIRTRLYPNSGGALKNLRKHIHLARRLSTT